MALVRFLPGALASGNRRLPGTFLVRAALLAAIHVITASALHAQNLADYDYEDLEFRGVGVAAGRVWPARVEPTQFVDLHADLGFVGPNIRILPSARFWSSSLKEEELTRLSEQIVLVCSRQPAATCPDDLDLGEVKLSDLELSLDAEYIFLAGRRLSPYLGAAASLHLLNGRGDFIDDTFVEDLLDTVAPGLGPIFGVNLQLGSSLRLRLGSRLMLASDVRYAGVGLGGVWQLPTRAADNSRPPAGN